MGRQSVIHNVETADNRRTHSRLKQLVADVDGLDGRCRRILADRREQWWGVPYIERQPDVDVDLPDVFVQ